MSVCIIPARGGSKRIPRKNIKPFFGKPMIAWSIETAQKANIFSQIIVSTDDNEIATLAESNGAEVPFIRPTELAEDLSSDRGFLLHAMNWLKDNENQLPEYWVHLRPTTPLREVKIIYKAIVLIINT